MELADARALVEDKAVLRSVVGEPAWRRCTGSGQEPTMALPP
jgi:hypothetical protein